MLFEATNKIFYKEKSFEKVKLYTINKLSVGFPEVFQNYNIYYI